MFRPHVHVIGRSTGRRVSPPSFPTRRFQIELTRTLLPIFIPPCPATFVRAIFFYYVFYAIRAAVKIRVADDRNYIDITV